MTQSYLIPDNTTPIRDIDKVRLLIGETDITDDVSNIEDEEIDFFISEEANVYMAASMAALAVARKLQSGGLEDLKVGETRIRTKRVSELTALADRLRDRGSAYKLPSAGGVYVADKEAYEKDTTLIQPQFKTEMHDFKKIDDRTTETS
jgi:hypothetical protein